MLSTLDSMSSHSMLSVLVLLFVRVSPLLTVWCLSCYHVNEGQSAWHNDWVNILDNLEKKESWSWDFSSLRAWSRLTLSSSFSRCLCTRSRCCYCSHLCHNALLCSRNLSKNCSWHTNSDLDVVMSCGDGVFFVVPFLNFPHQCLPFALPPIHNFESSLEVWAKMPSHIQSWDTGIEEDSCVFVYCHAYCHA